MHFAYFNRLTRIVAATIALAACGSDSSGTTGPGEPGFHAVVTPDSTASVDARVEKTPSVILVDASGKARSGVRVTYRVVAGGGKITDSVVSTDASGRAALGSWTLGAAPSENIVEANADGEATLRFSVKARWPRRLATSALGACAIVGQSTRCWGDNSHSEFGINFGPASSPTPVAAALTTFALTELAGSFGSHFCGIGADRNGACWGRNDFGQAGSSLFRTAGIPGSPLFGRTWNMLSAGRITTCGIESQGLALCWGANQWGEIGNPATAVIKSISGIPAPTLVIANGVRFKEIAAGWQHACGLSTDGVVYCWGTNLGGQLGISTLDSIRANPTPVESSERFESISAGGKHTCGITIDHRAFCWGQNAHGQLGDGTQTTRLTPTAVAGGMKFVSIVASMYFISPLPPEVPTAPALGSAAHTCAIAESGQAYCWGWNGWGQLGDGTLEDRLTPKAVSGSLILNGLALGESSSCGMRGTTVWCWGGNSLGQLGDGTTTRRLIPTQVLLP